MAVAVAPVRVALRGFLESAVDVGSAPRWGHPIWPAEEVREAQSTPPTSPPVEMLTILLGRNSG